MIGKYRARVSAFALALMFGVATKASAATYAQRLMAIQPANLRLYLPLNETSGTLANNPTGNGVNGSYSGVTLNGLLSPDSLSAGAWDGVNDLVTVSDAPVLNMTSQMTIAAWVRLNAINNFDGVVQKSDPGWASGGYGLYFAYGALHCWASDSYTKQAEASFSISGQWVLLACTYDGAIMRLYQNANQIASANFTTAIAPIAEPVLIGSANGGSYLDGSVAHVAIWDTALTASEVAELASVIEPPQVQSAHTELISLDSGKLGGIRYEVSAGEVLIASLLITLVMVTLWGAIRND
jgi:large repetitive protein